MSAADGVSGAPDAGPDAGDVPGFGEALRSAREQAGRSLEQLSAATRLRVGVLRDLERGDLTSCGGPVYARGHARSIAAALGVDPAPLLAALEAQRQPPSSADGGSTPVPLQVSRSVALGPGAGVPDRTGARWGTALLAAVAVLVVLLGVGVVTGGEARRQTTAGDALASAPGAQPPASPKPSRRAAPPDVTAEVRDNGARLRVRVESGASWMRVEGSDGTLFEGTLRESESPKDFRDARELRLLVGNAAAVSVVCGRKDLAPAGEAGRVKRFTCRSSGLVAA